ncbi:MAG: hypothetical protein LBQ00_04440 [Syntrophobacterales bacterium]|jgi:hypothetical protein|nr:hypothetical protein [Syntrophobacterales bacterium]
MKKLIVDIDNTLWDFSAVLYKRMVKVNPELTLYTEWHDLDFWKKYVTPRAFYSFIRDIHMDQYMFTPYHDAAPFLSSLKENGFHIIIASHRQKEALDPTERWLRANNLLFDEIHLSYDKTVLFDDCFGIVDDSPLILGKAYEAGIMGTGLKMPWNKYKDYPLFDSLTEVSLFVNSKHDAFRSPDYPLNPSP